jgi:hypothetical protein
LQDWQAQGVFEQDEAPAIYFLTERFTLKGEKEKVRQGFFALTQLEEFSTGTIRPRKTLDAPKEDRLSSCSPATRNSVRSSRSTHSQAGYQPYACGPS